MKRYERHGLQLDGAVALVTGASCGIGAATAVELSRRGAHVALVARRPVQLEATARSCQGLGTSVAPIVGDISTDAGARQVIDRVRAELGPIDALVNNAGQHVFKGASDTALDDVDLMFSVNFFGPLALTLEVLLDMVRRGRGSVVNVTSVTATLPDPGEAAYGASKAALSLWSHSAGLDLHGSGVTLGVVSPGPIDTETSRDDTYYSGRRYSAELVARDIVRSIERGTAHRTSPRRFGLVTALYPACGAPLRAAIARHRNGNMRRAS